MLLFYMKFKKNFLLLYLCPFLCLVCLKKISIISITKDPLRRNQKAQTIDKIISNNQIIPRVSMESLANRVIFKTTLII